VLRVDELLRGLVGWSAPRLANALTLSSVRAASRVGPCVELAGDREEAARVR
jgi:hypothetical protein